MTIRVYSRSVYGRELMYVADEAAAKAVAVLTRRTTVSIADLYALRALGVAVEAAPDPSSAAGRSAMAMTVTAA